MYEAVFAALPDVWVLRPTDPEALQAIAAQHCHPSVVWFDDLNPTAVAMRRLVEHGIAVLVTLLVGRAGTLPTGVDDKTSLFYLPAELSTGGQDAALILAASDRRVDIAMAASNSAAIPALIAGPNLVRGIESPFAARAGSDRSSPRRAPGERVESAAFGTGEQDCRRWGCFSHRTVHRSRRRPRGHGRPRHLQTVARWPLRNGPGVLDGVGRATPSRACAARSRLAGIGRSPSGCEFGTGCERPGRTECVAGLEEGFQAAQDAHPAGAGDAYSGPW
jgi:hypothetical protein